MSARLLAVTLAASLVWVAMVGLILLVKQYEQPAGNLWVSIPLTTLFIFVMARSVYKKES